jgi:hypothetical protein
MAIDSVNHHLFVSHGTAFNVVDLATVPMRPRSFGVIFAIFYECTWGRSKNCGAYFF